MKDPRNILTEKPGMGMKGLLLAMAIPAALITSTMFYSVDQLNTAGARETLLVDSIKALQAIAPKTITTFDTLLQKDTVTIAGRDTVIEKDTVVRRVVIEQKAEQSLTGVWADRVELVASNNDREKLIMIALRKYPNQEGMEKLLRSQGYFRLNQRATPATTDTRDSRISRETLSRSARVVNTPLPVYIILNPLRG